MVSSKQWVIKLNNLPDLKYFIHNSFPQIRMVKHTLSFFEIKKFLIDLGECGVLYMPPLVINDLFYNTALLKISCNFPISVKVTGDKAYVDFSVNTCWLR